jgi:hypothetical protein
MISYQKAFKPREILLAELKVIAPVIEEVEASGTAIVVFCSTELTDDEKTAVALYNCFTLEPI